MKEEFFIHPNALVDKNVDIGVGTTIYAFTHVLPGVKIGSNCNLNDHVFVESGVSIGNSVTVKCGVYLWEGITVEDDVFIGPGAVFTNDRTPRSKQYPEVFLKTRLQKGCSIGANATILPEIEIGEYALVGAGSVVTRNVPNYALVAGNPAVQVGWVCKCGKKLQLIEDSTSCCGIRYRTSANSLVPF